MPEGGRYELRSRGVIGGGHYDPHSSRVIIHAGSKSRRIWSAVRDQGPVIQELTEVPRGHDVFGSGLCLLPGDVIEGGGLALTGGEKRSKCSQFLFGQSAWSDLPELSAPRWGHGSVCVRGTLLVIGGSLPCEWSGTVECLDLSRDPDQEDAAWQPGPTAPESLYCPKVTVLGSHVYVLDDYTGKLFCLDAETGEWISKTGLGDVGIGGPVRGSGLAVAGDGKLYLAGSTCRVYDPVNDTWHAANPPSHNHYYGSLVRWGQDKLLLAGGDTNFAEIYDVSSDTWSDAAFKLPGQTSFGHAFSVDA